jgi:uncharacterized membrane protein YphA (DoxX/SURF4 family)
VTAVAAQVRSRPQSRTVLSWVLRVALALVFAGAGAGKLAGTPEMVAMFAEIGAGQWLRHLVGALEVAGAVGVLVPRLAGTAALGLAALMVGATLTNLLVLQATVGLPLALLLVAVVAVRLSRPSLRPAG